MALETLLREGGPIMPLLLLAALVGYVLTAERLLVWGTWHLRDRALVRAPDGPALAAAVETAVSRRPTPLTRLLGEAVRLRHLPTAQRETALQARLLGHLPQVDARLSTIGWLGGILPMLGLLGTVSGMITTFQDLSVTTSRQILSVGLSEALWTTEVGLLGALPLLAAHHLLTRMRARWLNALERGLALLAGERVEAGEAGDEA